jgi:hypothetical protein
MNMTDNERKTLQAIGLDAWRTGNPGAIGALLDKALDLDCDRRLVEELRAKRSRATAARVYVELNDCRYLRWEEEEGHKAAIELQAMLHRAFHADETRITGEPFEVVRALIDKFKLPHIVIEPTEPRSAVLLRLPCRLDEGGDSANDRIVSNLNILIKVRSEGLFIYDYPVSNDTTDPEQARAAARRRGAGSVVLWQWNDLMEALRSWTGEEEES